LGTYRTRLAIIADVLLVASGDAKKTQIMYGANLSYKVLQRYLAEITAASLINFDDERKCYVLTDKGREFLEVYQEYSRTSKHVEKKLNDVHAKQKFLYSLCSDE
jgi:predicted transcriptional regulator